MSTVDCSGGTYVRRCVVCERISDYQRVGCILYGMLLDYQSVRTCVGVRTFVYYGMIVGGMYVYIIYVS